MNGWRRFWFAWLVCALFVLSGCGGGVPREEASGAARDPDARAEAMLRAMTPAEKLGQMMIIGVRGTELDGDSRFMLAEYAMGGVVLFDRNAESAEGVRRFVRSLQEARAGEPPLFIAVDEEGGAVVRMADILPPPPSQAAIGASGDPSLARRWAADTARSLKSFGFNLNFAPVADVGGALERSYAGDADTAAAFVREAAAGYEAEGMLCTLKHFPGLGRGETDTHLGRVAVGADADTLLREDAAPFRAVVREMAHERFMVMVSHIVYTALDPERPASRSPAVLSLLRDRLGYRGVVVTDDLEMGAAADGCPDEELGVRAVEAGADLLLVCHTYERQAAVYNGLLKALRAGRLSEARVDASVRRILRAKLAYGM